MLAMPFALATAMSVVPASDERGMFRFPKSEDVRLQTVMRSDNERDWPFSIDSGYLACVWSAGQKVVMFMEKLSRTEVEQRDPAVVLVSTNPFDLTLLNIPNRHLIARMDSVEELIRRMAPFYDLGVRLCDQPRGAEIGPGEL